MLNTGRALLAIAAVVILGLTGVSWATLQSTENGMTTDNIIGQKGGGPQPADGSTDILLVGLDSRTDVQGNPLPPQVLASLHAGDNEGEVNTDTMILIHIPNNGGQAVGVSIPRDSWVNIPGYGYNRINAAYGDAKATEAKKQRAQGDTNAADVERRSNEAGAQLAIDTVQNLTGVTIDHCAEVNLYGFDQLSQAIGGVPVCLNHAVNDPYSGAVFPAGYFSVEGVRALKFVRQRHNIPGGSTDLEREARQQAFLASMAHKVLSAGTLTNPGELSKLITAIQKSIVIDSHWNLIDFASQMAGMSSGNIKFETIPIVTMDYWPDGKGPNKPNPVEFNPAQVAAFVRGTAGRGTPPTNVGATSSPSTGNAPATGNGAITVDVRNGSGRDGLAARVLGKLTGAGFGKGDTGNISSRGTSMIYYHAGQQANGDAVASALGGHVTIAEGASVPSGHVWVYLGTRYSSEGISTAADDWALPALGQNLPLASGNGTTLPGTHLTGPARQGNGDPSTISDSGDAPPCVN